MRQPRGFLALIHPMSEDLSQAVPATTATSEAVPPVRAIDSDDPALLRNKIELTKSDRDKAVAEKQSYKKQVEELTRQNQELQADRQKRDQAQLARNGDFQKLWEDQKGTVSDLQSQLAAKDEEMELMRSENQQQQIKVSAYNAIQQSGVVNTDQAYQLLKADLRMKDGELIALSGGVEVPIGQRLEQLKQPGSGWEHHFSGSGARGMSAGSSTSIPAGTSWSSLGTLKKLELMETNPQLAAQLKAAG